MWRQQRGDARSRRELVVLMLLICAGCGGETPPTPGISGDTIAVGALSPMSDAVAVIGKPIVAGLQMYFNALNARGGVGNRYHVKLLVEDVTYANPSTSVQKYAKIKADVAMMAQILGTDHINTVLPLLSEDSIVAVPTTFDAEWVREPQLIPWGPPYQIQAINGVAYFLGEGGGQVKRMCALTIATGYGDAGLEGLQFAAKDMGFEVVAAARFKQDDQDFVAPITQLKNARCEGVLLVSLPGVTGRLLGAAAQLSFAPRWIALFPAWHPSLAESPLRDYFAKNLWVVWDGPEWGDTTVTGMRDLLRAVAAQDATQKPDLYLAAGWMIAGLTHQTLERAAAAGDFSRAGMVNATRQLGRVDFDGLVSSYTYGTPEQREPPRTSSIFAINPAKPVAIQLVKAGFESPSARKFTFERRQR